MKFNNTKIKEEYEWIKSILHEGGEKKDIQIRKEETERKGMVRKMWNFKICSKEVKKMPMESGSMERRNTMTTESLEGFSNMSLLNEEIVKQEKDLSRLHSEMRVMEIEVLKRMLNASDNLYLHVSAINLTLNKQSQQMGIFEQKLNAIESEVKKLALDVTKLSPSVVVIDKNLKEVRNLAERVADKTESLSEEFVERYVKDPLIENVASLYNIVRQMSRERDGEEHSVLLEQVRQLLDAQDARIIEPETGSTFDPREHRPVKRITTPCKDLENKISRVFRSGFGRNGRVVQHAIVELFVLEEARENKNTKKEVEQNGKD